MINSILAAILEQPMTISGFWRLGMLAPLALSISVVYKTIHCRKLRDIPLASLMLAITIVGGMLGIGIGLLLVFRLLA